MAKTNRAYLMLGWLAGRLVMGKRSSIRSGDSPPVIPEGPENVGDFSTAEIIYDRSIVLSGPGWICTKFPEIICEPEEV